MAENSVVRARIDEATKIEAAAVLASMLNRIGAEQRSIARQSPPAPA
jgi:hypothetical protein